MYSRIPRLITNSAFIACVVLTPPAIQPQSMPRQPFELNTELQSLPILNNAETRSISPENPTGEKGKGGRHGHTQPFGSGPLSTPRHP